MNTESYVHASRLSDRCKEPASPASESHTERGPDGAVWAYRSDPSRVCLSVIFFFQAEDGIRDLTVTGVQTCALPIYELLERGRLRQEPARKRAAQFPGQTVHAQAARRCRQGDDGRLIGSKPTSGAKIGRASCRERV